MPDSNDEIRERLANLKLEPASEAAIVGEPAEDLADCYADLRATAQRRRKLIDKHSPS
jgi:hypothetical protein